MEQLTRREIDDILENIEFPKSTRYKSKVVRILVNFPKPSEIKNSVDLYNMPTNSNISKKSRLGLSWTWHTLENMRKEGIVEKDKVTIHGRHRHLSRKTLFVYNLTSKGTQLKNKIKTRLNHIRKHP